MGKIGKVDATIDLKVNRTTEGIKSPCEHPIVGRSPLQSAMVRSDSDMLISKVERNAILISPSDVPVQPPPTAPPRAVMTPSAPDGTGVASATAAGLAAAAQSLAR